MLHRGESARASQETAVIRGKCVRTYGIYGTVVDIMLALRPDCELRSSIVMRLIAQMCVCAPQACRGLCKAVAEGVRTRDRTTSRLWFPKRLEVV